MFNPFLSAEQQQIVVFPLWKSLSYQKRFLAGFGSILLGFLIQYWWWYHTFLLVISFFPVLFGSLLFIVKGYDNRVKFGKYSPDSGWEQVGEPQLSEIKQFVKKIKKWDRSEIDISNNLGRITLIILLVILAIFLMIGFDESNIPFIIFAIDGFLLFFPHWIFGTRSIQTQSKLLLKIKVLEELLHNRNIQGCLYSHTVEYLLLLRNPKRKKAQKIPDDIKIRVNFQGQHQDFLGYYGQIVVNEVGDKKYPYFYVVLVAKKGYGLKPLFTTYTPPAKIIKQYKKQEDVEVLIIRQKTTKTSGYHTKGNTIRKIFLEGLELAEQVAVRAG